MQRENNDVPFLEMISRERIYRVRFSLKALMHVEDVFGDVEKAGIELRSGKLKSLIDFLECAIVNPDSETGRYSRDEVIEIIEGIDDPTPVGRIGVAMKIATQAFKNSFPDMAGQLEGAAPESEAAEEGRRKNSSAPTVVTTGRSSRKSASGR